VSGTLYYFDSGPNSNDLTLWTSNGATNTQIADFSNGSDFVGAYAPIDVRGKAYFFVIDSTTGTGELWTSNGTSAGTLPIAAVNPDIAFDSGSNAIADAVAVGGRLFFTATDPIKGEQLWVSNGASGGTHIVSSIVQGQQSGNALPFDLIPFDGRLFFVASDPAHGAELWSSNGTPDGTGLVQDINPGPAGSAPSWLTVVDDTLFMAATDQTHGRELWAYRRFCGEPSADMHQEIGRRVSVWLPPSLQNDSIARADNQGSVADGTVRRSKLQAIEDVLIEFSSGPKPTASGTELAAKQVFTLLEYPWSQPVELEL
jgi:ELWxxDGT repeat protein